VFLSPFLPFYFVGRRIEVGNLSDCVGGLGLNLDFWGPASNFGIPIAAVMDITRKDPEVYSAPFPFSLPSLSFQNSFAQL
jgi:hypothetical protein